MWCSFYLWSEKLGTETAFLVILYNFFFLKPFSSGFSIMSKYKIVYFQNVMQDCIAIQVGGHYYIEHMTLCFALGKTIVTTIDDKV